MRLVLLTCLALLASPSLAQTAPAPAGAAPSPMAQAGMRYVGCLRTKVRAAPTTVAPEAVADAAIAGCKTEHDQLIAVITPVIASLPPEQQAMAKAHMQEEEAGLPAKIASDLRTARASSTGTAPATPAK